MKNNNLINICVGFICLLFVVSCDKKSSDHIPDKRLKFTYENNIGKKVTSDIYDNYAFIIVEDDRTYNAKYYFYNVINSTIIEKNNINEFIKLLAIIPKGETLGFYSYCQPTFRTRNNANLILIADFCRKNGINIIGNSNYRFNKNEVNRKPYYARILCTCD
ncbi:MAG TPA: hypothetical protein PLE16_11860 [Spirochaetota bacterium]|nr:hypothetical protein [Spirochaetota bacterium]HOH36756.1 hypothetical protein [Spirochaetota bacterium]HPJ15011.1 hypothetical protein [Spirochaetota bacterium]HPM35276.1 hypothetical protein [Spirochaetota bacterium]HPY03103.1 hypothetical protein [Spirochaetota bacterium]